MSRISPLRLAAVLLVAGTAAACSDGAPTSASTDLGSLAPRASLTQAERVRKDSLESKLDQARARIEKAKKTGKDAFDADKKAWKAEEKLAKQSGALSILRCEPQPYAGDAEIIGPDGGEIQMGAHRLRIPKNALAEPTLIVGESSAGSFVAVEFEPHGLTFAVRPQLTLSYSHCPALEKQAKHTVVYVDESAAGFEFPQSSDAKGLEKVTALLEHFSSYMIAYRSGMTAQ